MANENTNATSSMDEIVAQFIPIVKQSMRLTSDVFNNELGILISAAVTDLEQATDGPFNPLDLTMTQAVIIYCQANFGYGDEKAEKRYQDILKRIGLRKINPANRTTIGL